ncbi:MAG: fibronectin type III domain-containing protein, partial [Armatimonadetes bacterium]|nr:fibronectin type III domain-containing protein [Armatimonadota bacterium]
MVLRNSLLFCFLSVLAMLVFAASAFADFTAYNDCVWNSTHPPLQPNVTTINIGSGSPGPSSGVLKDFYTGASTGVTATLTQSGGVVWQPDLSSGGDDCPVGTDARNVFNTNTASLKGVIYYGSSGWYVDLTFTGLNPNMEYEFVTSANRNGSSYTTRLTKYTISGADAFVNESTPGVTIGSGGASSTFCTGYNINGYVARWTHINPGADGTFKIRAEAGSSEYRAYAFSAFMLKETASGSRVAITSGPFATITGTDSATITWTTSVEADSTVYYGNSPSNLAYSVSDSTEVTNHSINLTGLTPGQDWYYKVVSAKPPLDPAESGVIAMNLHITNVSAIPLGAGALVKWTTDSAASSIVYYGTDQNNLNQSFVDPNPVTSHSVNLTGLDADTVYFYKVRSEADRFFPAESTVGSFKTPGIGELVNPNFETGSLTPWFRSYGSGGDYGLRNTAWFNNMGNNRPEGAGEWYLGQAASWGNVRSVTSQVVACEPNTYYVARGWIYTSSWSSDPFVSREMNCVNNIGIDPNGNTDPGYTPSTVPAERLAASTAIWFRSGDDWSECSSQVPGSAAAIWKQIAVGATSGPSATNITVHLLMHQSYPYTWNLNGFDLISLDKVTPVSTIGEAKTAGNTSPVNIASAIVTAVFFGDDGLPVGFAIEEPDRFAGIRVVSDAALSAGDDVTIVGTTSTVNGERVISATSVTINSSGNTPPDPVIVFGIETGGGEYGAQGAVVDDATSTPVKWSALCNNVGLLMKIRGKVRASVSGSGYGDSYFYVDDAYGTEDYETGIKDGSGNIGIKCRAPVGMYGMPGSLPSVGDYVEVTGVMGVQQISGKNARYFWTV